MNYANGVGQFTD